MSKSRNKGTDRDASQRQLRVGEQLRQAISEVLLRGDLRDPALVGASVTVSEVRASPDLRRATAYVMPLGGGGIETVVEALNRAAPYLRRQIARVVQLKYAPLIDFQADTSFDYAGRIDQVLHDPTVAADLAAPGASAPDDPPPYDPTAENEDGGA